MKMIMAKININKILIQIIRITCKLSLIKLYSLILIGKNNKYIKVK